MARWIERRSNPRVREVEARVAARATLDHISETLDGRKLAAAPKASKNYLPDPLPPTSVEAELRRIGDGTPTHWTSSLRSQLLAEGLIEITKDGDGKWTGDRITKAGLRRIGRE